MIGQLVAAMPLAFAIWSFTLGAVIGSFLNVVIARVPHGESLVHPGSRCPRCKSPIRWFDNIPIVSWIALRAKCRNCGLPISARYPVVELLCGLIALGIARQTGPTVLSLADFAFAAALVSLAYIDLDTWLLPPQITIPLLALGLASPLWNRELSWLEALLGAGIGWALFAAIALIGEKLLKRETMGWGDVWLLGGIGAWLGWGALLPVILLSALQGSIAGGVLLLAGKGEPGPAQDDERAPQHETLGPSAADGHLDSATDEGEDDWVPPKNAVPFGPFLALAALEYLFAGARLVSGWNHLLMRLLG